LSITFLAQLVSCYKQNSKRCGSHHEYAVAGRNVVRLEWTLHGVDRALHGIQGLGEKLRWRTIGQPKQSFIGTLGSKNNRFAVVLPVDKGVFENVVWEESNSVRIAGYNKWSIITEYVPKE
jgi:hypothetical protein